MKYESPLYHVESVGSISSELRLIPLESGEIELNLRITNDSMTAAEVTPTFPLFKGLSPGGNPNQLSYCFPKRGAVIGNCRTRLREPYGGAFPLQFMDAYHPEAGGIYIMTHDESNTPKSYWLEKSLADIDMGVDYWRKTLNPGETWELPRAVIGAHQGDWHEAFYAYRGWLRTWYRPSVGRKDWFRRIYTFRQLFLHYNSAIGADGFFDPDTKEYSLTEAVLTDEAAFGGVDYIHLFDWGYDPVHGRVGDYDPWNYLGGVDGFRNEVVRVQERGIPVGLYFEGYLLSPTSNVAQENGNDWQLLNSSGNPYSRFGTGYYYMCPHSDGWQSYITDTCERVWQQTNADGFYLDQYGFCYQYPCYNPSHNHIIPISQITGEATITRMVRNVLPSDRVIYTEETPTDVSTQYQDGSFSYAVNHARTANSVSKINLTRFALPDFKIFEIIRCDQPLEDDYVALHHVFFNGEGIWIEGPSSEWFSDRVLSLIRKTHQIFHDHSDAFCSMNPKPLVPTLHEDIYANEFSATDETVWTLYNASDAFISGYLLAVPHSAGAIYYDAWTSTVLTPQIEGSRASIWLEIEAYGVGCIVQVRSLGLLRVY